MNGSAGDGEYYTGAGIGREIGCARLAVGPLRARLPGQAKPQEAST